jgi:UDP-glucose 4-epimerase
VYGPRQDPHGEAGVVAIFCGLLREGGTPVIFGDGRQTRDYIYVGDVVDAFLAAGSSDREGALNVATGVETSLRELAAKIGLDARAGAARPGEVLRSCLAPEAAADALGWRACTTLDEGLERTSAAVGQPSGPSRSSH